MTNQQVKTGDLKFSRYYQQFSNKNGFSNRTLFVSFFPLVLANLTLDFGRLPGTLSQWFIVSALGYTAMVLVVLLLRKLFSKLELPSALYLPIYYLLGMVRGVAIYFAGVQLGVVPEGEFTYRLVGSGIYVFCVIPISTILVSNFNRASQTLGELQAQTLRRTKRLNSMKLEIAEQKTEIAGRVNGLLLPVITDLMNRVKVAKSSDVGRQISALLNTVDTVVRPLSQSVANEGNRLSDPQVELERASLISRLNPKTKLKASHLFLPWLSTFLLTLMCSSPIITISGIETGLVILLVMAVATFGILALVKRLTQGVNLTAVPALLLVLLSYLAVSGVVLFAIAELNNHLLPISVPRLISLNVLFGLSFFVAQSRYQLLQQSSASLEEVNRELELLNAQAKQELWLNRRRIATVLHGPVQAALYASAMRLSQAKKPSKKLLQEINSDLADALKALSFEHSDITSVRTVIREIIDVWAGVCDIYFSLPKSVFDVTKKNPNAAESFVEIIREAVSNAIKHGSATEIEVSAKLESGIIQLQVVNNGKKPNRQQASTGYGTQILNELALAWNLGQSDSGKVAFTAEIVADI